MAEEEGFEPPIPFRVRQFSRLEPSTTRPLFRTIIINDAQSRWHSLMFEVWKLRRRSNVCNGTPFASSESKNESCHLNSAFDCERRSLHSELRNDTQWMLDKALTTRTCSSIPAPGRNGSPPLSRFARRFDDGPPLRKGSDARFANHAQLRYPPAGCGALGFHRPLL